MRMSFCRALILLRHRNMLEPSELLTLFFDLLRCQDKGWGIRIRIRTLSKENIFLSSSYLLYFIN